MRKPFAQGKVRRALLVAALMGLGALPVLLLVVNPWGLILVLAFRASLEKPHLNPDDLEQVVRELKGQGFEPGLHPGVALSERFRPLASAGTVDLFITRDGRTIVLFKTSIGWKGNYRGIVFSDAPLKAEEVEASKLGGRDYLNVFGYPFVRQRISDREYEVFFDLG